MFVGSAWLGVKTRGPGILPHSLFLPKTHKHFTEGIDFQEGKAALIWQGVGGQGDQGTETPRINGIFVPGVLGAKLAFRKQESAARLTMVTAPSGSQLVVFSEVFS